MGIDQNTVPTHGWAEIGKKTYSEQIGGKVARLSMVAGYVCETKKTIAEFEFSGTMNQDLFNGWFEQVLLPELESGTTIILDNASVHKSPEILDIARYSGCKVLFLPPYSPDLNPIEKFWANLKKAIRSVIRKATSFQKAITMGYEKDLSG
jgi:isfu1 transposase